MSQGSRQGERNVNTVATLTEGNRLRRSLWPAGLVPWWVPLLADCASRFIEVNNQALRSW